MVKLSDLYDPAPPAGPDDWNDRGVVYLPGFLPEGLMTAYEEEWKRDNGFHTVTEWGNLVADRPGGYEDVAYLKHPALFHLATYGPLALELEKLMGEPAGVHLNLSGWVSTERDWHQDTYLNPPHVGDKYAAVWMALDNIRYDSGPFQYAAGSHRWFQLTREKIGAVVDLRDPMWPKHSEDVLSPLVTREIQERHANVTTYLPRRGDVLIWHGRLLHRGSKPENPGAIRPALISHYSGINHRQDMPRAQQALSGGWFYPL